MTTLPDESDTPPPVGAPVAPVAAAAAQLEAEEVAETAEAVPAEKVTLKSAGLRGLLAGLVFLQLTICLLWAAIAVTLMALQVQQIDPVNYAGQLGLVLGVGAIGSMVGGPIMGTVSDRVRSRLGPRVPIILVGAVLTLALMILTASATSIGMLILWWFLAQFVTVGFISTAMWTYLPDRVPLARRGTFSAALGMSSLIGATVGQAVASAFATQVFVGYVVIGLLVVVGCVVVAFVGSRSNVGEPRRPVDVKALLSTFWVSPRKHPAFAWTFLLLQDYVGLGTEGAVAVVPVVGVATLVGVLVSTPTAGWLVDRLGRTKPILMIVAAVLGIGSLVPLAFPTTTGLIVYAALAGFGFGAYLSVDYVLITQVLPSSEDAAKDLGIINISATLPTTVAAGGAGLIITLFNGYTALFPIAAVLGLLGGLLLLPVRGVR
jgi:MFS family permease